MLNVAYYDAQVWVHQKSLESSEVWCWRRTKKVSWTDRVKNEKYYKEESRKKGKSYIQ
jgi:hypothetical protein